MATSQRRWRKLDLKFEAVHKSFDTNPNDADLIGVEKRAAIIFNELCRNEDSILSRRLEFNGSIWGTKTLHYFSFLFFILIGNGMPGSKPD